MAYSSGLLNKKIAIWAVNRDNQTGKAGRGSAGVKYDCLGCVWGAITWSKGMRAMREGALEAYDVVMIRMRWNSLVDKDSRLTCEGKTYQILQFNSDRRENQIQITAQQTNEQLGRDEKTT